MKKFNINTKMKKTIIGAVILCVTVVSVFSIYSSGAKSQIYALGYSEKEVEKFIAEYGVFEASEKVENELNAEITAKEDKLATEIGVSPTLINNYDSLTRVEYNNELDSFIEYNTTIYTTAIAEADQKLANYAVVSEFETEGVSLYTQLSNRNKLIYETEINFEVQIEEKKAALVDYGMRSSEVDALITGDYLKDLEALNSKVTYYENFNAMVSTSGNSYASGSMDLFNILNNHRVSKGLPAFRYNAEQQSCVDVEANSYANNKNPHNWLCKTLTSEGASLASSSSNYIQIAGNFLTTHGSHEADVVNPNYTSAACSAVERDGMVYMICGYFR